MKSEFIPEKTQKEPTFPCYLKNIDIDVIVLFTDVRTGVVVYSGCSDHHDDWTKLNFYCNNWSPATGRQWKPVRGEIRITLP